MQGLTGRASPDEETVPHRPSLWHGLPTVQPLGPTERLLFALVVARSPDRATRCGTVSRPCHPRCGTVSRPCHPPRPDRTSPLRSLWHGLPTVPPTGPDRTSPLRARCGTVSRPCHPPRPD